MNAAQMLPSLKNISCSGDLLSDFVENFPDSCHVRDVQTNKYLMTNHHMVNSCSLQSIDDIIGFTQSDIWIDSAIQKKRNLSETVISSIVKDIKLDNKIENEIVSTKHPIRIKRFILNDNGTIIFENAIKIGVQNHDNKTIAFLNIFLNLTNQIPLHKLFSLYKEFYLKKEAIQKFLSHFSAEVHFDPLRPLTNTEIQILISMRHDSRCKAVANALGMSVATAGNHISHIRDKLKSGTLYDVLFKFPTIPESQQSMYVYI